MWRVGWKKVEFGINRMMRGETLYGKFGFRPYELDDMKETKKFRSMYENNIKIANLKIIDRFDLMKKYLGNKLSDTEFREEEFIESLTESQIKALQRWLDTDDNHERIKEIKDKIKLLLYNRRDLIINSKDE